MLNLTNNLHLWAYQATNGKWWYLHTPSARIPAWVVSEGHKYSCRDRRIIAGVIIRSLTIN